MSSEGPRIAVAMSTYNGADHVAEQLDSVLAQDAGPAAVYVRDDGSTDATLDVLAPYEARGQIVLLRGTNLGVTGSFLELLSLVPAEFDFVALADQDDVWHEDKLSRALSVIGGCRRDAPVLYCSEYVFCDAEMVPQGRSHLNRSGVDFARMLYENVTSGNTMVLNRCLADLVAGAGREGVYCHDWWIALVASALGEIRYDDFCSLEYRRCGSNASPTGSSGPALLRYRVRTFLSGDGLARVTEQLEKLEACFGDRLAPDRRALLRRFLRGGRLSKALAPVRLRQGVPEELALRLAFVLGLL
ncbi:glycosyltransferase [Olsenella sp. An293]|uniref:glycosyltransferase n=1 Tax=Olsenella sp. An293 TaxID=1965626 RepID=UPI000B38EDA9|nr:glycosyltransferase [Olsenella sp. An293]OUO33419.1 hypothetical protein B5F85_02945 [Olsenella sp. An293]